MYPQVPYSVSPDGCAAVPFKFKASRPASPDGYAAVLSRLEASRPASPDGYAAVPSRFEASRPASPDGYAAIPSRFEASRPASPDGYAAVPSRFEASRPISAEGYSIVSQGFESLRPRASLSSPYVVSPVICLQKAALIINTLIISNDRARVQIETWKSYIATLQTNTDRLIEYQLVYNELCRLIEMTKDSLPDVTFSLLMQNFNEIIVFIDMCFRDFIDFPPGTDEVLTASTPFTIMPAFLPLFSNQIIMPENAPLRYLPTFLYQYDDYLKTEGIARYLNILSPTDGQTNPIDQERFIELIQNTMCQAPCHRRYPPEIFKSRAMLLINPFIRDRCLFYLQHKLRKGEAWRPPHQALATLQELNLFHPASPFVLMQRFIMDLESRVKQLGSPQATIIGNFKPITDPSIYPIPLFLDSDGNLLAFLWHGTSADNIPGIADKSFLLSHLGMGSSDRGFYGEGIYFAIEPCTALSYGNSLILSAVFLGKRIYFPDKKFPIPEPDATATIVIPRYEPHARHWEFVAPEASIVPLLTKGTTLHGLNPSIIPHLVNYDPSNTCHVM